jgi:hypothetical protein
MSSPALGQLRRSARSDAALAGTRALCFQLTDFSRMSTIVDKPPSGHSGCQTCAQQGHRWADGTTSTESGYQLEVMPTGATRLVLLLWPEGGGRWPAPRRSRG